MLYCDTGEFSYCLCFYLDVILLSVEEGISES